MHLSDQEHLLTGALAAHVRCVWQLQGAGNAEEQLIVPDGCMELVLNFGDPFEQVISAQRRKKQPRILIVGEVRRPVRTHPTGKIDLLGVRFAPGSAPLFFGTSAVALVDTLSNESAIKSRTFRRAMAKIFSAPSEERSSQLQAVLHDAFTAAAPRLSTVEPVALLVARQGLIDLTELETRTGMKKRTLERRFLTTVGCSPKALAQVLRFRRVLRSIEAAEVSWADTALECGYYDQAHLVRDFRRYTGITPGQYLKGDHPLTRLFDGVRPR